VRKRTALLGGVIAIVAIAIVVWWARGGGSSAKHDATGDGSAAASGSDDDPWGSGSGPKKPIRSGVVADDDPTIASTGAPAVVDGIVRDATTKQPIAGAEVAYWSKKGELTTESGGDGHYSIEVTTGAWNARATLGDDAMSHAHVVRVDAPKVTVDLEIEKLAHVHGIVRDASTHAPLAGVEVSVEPAEHAAREALEATVGRSMLSGADGSYKLASPAGEVRLKASAQGKLGHKAIPNVAPGADVTADLELNRDVAIDGKVVDEKGAPVAGAIVTVFLAVWDIDLNHKRTITTGADGRFAAKDLEPGMMTIDARGTDGSASEAKQFDISKGDVHDYVLTLSSPVAMRGKVTYADGRAATGATVRVRRSGVAGLFAETASATDGTFEVSGPRLSRYDFDATNEYGRARLYGVGTDDKIALVIHVPGGIRGHVKTKSGAATDYTVSIDRIQPADNQRTLDVPAPQRYTPTDGVFEWPKLDPGTYDLTVRGTGGVVALKGVVVPDGAWIDVDALLEPDSDAAARRPK